MIENKDGEEKPKAQKRVFSGKKMAMKTFMRMNHADMSHILSPELKASFGEIEDGFDVFIFGNTGDGKSSFSALVVKELSPLGRILHLVYEEGHSKSVRKNFLRAGVTELTGYDIMDNASFDDLMYLLTRKQSPKIIIIDSWQYCRFTKEQWFTLKNKFIKGRKKKVFIIISHADGKKPRGSVAIDVMYDAQIKVFLKGKIAFVKSRYEGTQNFVVWEEGAKKFWGNSIKKCSRNKSFNMPINYKEYHAKWSLISRLIRFRRAGNKCEWCGVPNGLIIHKASGKAFNSPWLQALSQNAAWQTKQPRFVLHSGRSRVVLTVAHIDRDKTNNRFHNLAALCQRCHLRHDLQQHIFNRKYGRKTKYLNGKLF